MAKIVEFYGLPGVGKSTIYEDLKGKWKKEFNWIPSHHLYTKKKIFESLSKFLLIVGRIIKDGNFDDVAKKEAGDRFVAQYPEFIDAFWNNILYKQKKSYNGLDLRFERAKYFYITIQKIQLLRESNSKKIALVDEGLIHRISRGLYKSENLIDELNEIKHLLQIMPLPDALVYVETDVQENAKRLAQRKKVISMHKSLSITEIENIIPETQERMENITKILENKGIPILRVDAKLHIETNVIKIKSFVEGLKSI
ncbi:MAG: hypothetical protein H0V14_07995 [Chitinophagaceae bacterium]|nr:hypothetical protein [Chitinophagaceae bacterium]